MTTITIRPASGIYTIRAKGAIIGETARAVELIEGGRAPVIYVPREDVAMAFLDRSPRETVCPYKGTASYYSVVTPEGRLENVVWTYETPKAGVEGIAGYLAFYPEVTVQRA
ncbi:DUF427 domain-containing protein [Paragemmobacter straminiformis]|uniref:DUF427 domain-containing protein n=1 Tax=Paragemmobacter straminiformis TaxID=2045119 RepID=A0A842I9J1_9RHOB|nr:DUF427 domain-containing protein [Gemmobacter straminiformis]MBC2835764.1 DUF427 domain-containing protein [Gemmobacter straminiformis]